MVVSLCCCLRLRSCAACLFRAFCATTDCCVQQPRILLDVSQSFYRATGTHFGKRKAVTEPQQTNILARGRESRNPQGTETHFGKRTGVTGSPWTYDPPGSARSPCNDHAPILIRKSRKHIVAKEKGSCLIRRVWHESLARRVWS